MSAFVYANGQYHLLAGNKIVKDAALLDMKSTDKIIVSGQAYNLGAGTTDEETPNIIHDNGNEPVTGTKWYVTPDGAGSIDGSSWANAAPASQVHAILLSCASGDSVYFSEGNYTTDRIITLPSGVSLFGGFPSENPLWETRDAFTHPTKWTASHSGAWLASTSNVTGQLVDGFTLINYVGTTEDGENLIFRNMTISGGRFSTGGEIKNSYFLDTTNTILVNAVKCIFNQCKSSGSLVYGPVSECVAIGCEIGNTTSAPILDTIFGNYAEKCICIRCKCVSNNRNFFGDYASNCTAINCISTKSYTSKIFGSNSTNCTAINCVSPGYIQCIFGSNSTNCTAINCGSLLGIFGSNSTNCTAINCIVVTENFNIFDSMAKNCSAFNCKADIIFKQEYTHIKNCLSWNNDGTEFSHPEDSTTCAGSTYNSALTLTLGTDNSIARFTNTGFAPAKGVQDVGDCPSPLDDPDGYAEWLSAFGDWHPAADSFLLGAGTADSSVTTDADGVTRPDPPAIGAYEAKPTQETTE